MMKKIFMILFICAVIAAGSGHVFAQSEFSNKKLEEISREITALKAQQQQILDAQKKILESLEQVKNTVNRIRGM